eukprot:11455719-Prorocentrum_lima.AAC.1
MTQIPPYQPRSNGLVGRMVGIVKDHMREVLHAAVEVGPTCWPYAAMYVADAMRHSSTGGLWGQPAFGEFVAVTIPGPKKALESRGQVVYYLLLPILDQQSHMCVGGRRRWE